MKLSDLACRKAKKAEKPYKMSDGGGLFLLVKTNGSKLWQQGYRFHGREKLLSFGQYPTVGLETARRKREEAKALLAAGRDPAEVKKEVAADTAVALGNTFRATAVEWFENKEKALRSQKYADQVWRRFEADVFPEIGDDAISLIKPTKILTMLRRVEKRGAIESARRLRQHVSEVFKFAIASGRADNDPTAPIRDALMPVPRAKHHSAPKDAELPTLIARINSYDGSRQTMLALRLILLTAVRTSEARFGRWEEDQGDVWRIPPERMKKGREHLVPIVPQTRRVLDELREIAGRSPFILPSPSKSGVISENTCLFALYRMGYHSKMTVHGFRGTFSTILNEQMDGEGRRVFESDWIERQLAHVEDNEIRGAYNSAEWMPARRRMMQWWADHLDQQAAIGGLIG